MKPVNEVLAGYGTTVFEVMSRLAMERGAINLGQGFPDEEGPNSLKEMLSTATRDFPNQYPPMLGIPELRQAIAAHNQRFHGIDADWQTQVMVTSGATEALAACILALINPDDEVVFLRWAIKRWPGADFTSLAAPNSSAADIIAAEALAATKGRA